MSKMRKTSLSHTFTLSITLFTACVIGFIAWFFYRQERAVLMAELQRHGVALAENLAFNCEYDLLFTDVESLSKLVDGVVQDQDVIYALIINTDGAIVVEKDFAHYARVEQTIHERFPQFLELIAPKHPPVQTPNVHFFENPDGTYDIFAPVFFIQNAETRRELLGIVVVGISVERVTGQLRNIQKQVVEVAVFMLVLAIIVARLLVNAVTRPIEKLANGTQRIARGELTQEVQIKSSNEIGELAQSFNQMMHDLRASRQELERWAQTMEQRVNERTYEIQEKNQKLTELVEQMKAMQEQLVHSEKMASLGQLVAGIAHEINNPVNFISSNITPLKTYIANVKKIILRYDRLDTLTPEQRTDIKEMKQVIDFDFVINDIDDLIQDIGTGAQRIKRIVQDLRNFSRLDEAELKIIDLHDSLDTTLNLLGHLYENRILVSKQYGTIPPVECYAGQLNQVFMNLLANAAQAIEYKGNVWITTSFQEDQVAQKAWVYVSIRDDGTGIPEDVLSKIFDPFFTTKDVGEGTGLGLSISYGIIEKHRGEIIVTSQVGEGTEFVVKIPQKLSQKRQLHNETGIEH